MPGYKVAAWDLCTVDQKYICPSCGLVLRDAVQLTCGHHYCETCLTYMQRHDNLLCLNIECEESLANVENFPDHFIRREISCLIMTCKHKDDGCGWRGELKEIDVHHGNCQYRIMMCGNQNCNEHVPAGRLMTHQEQECLHRPVVCEHCNAPETAGSLQNHVANCPNVPVQCMNCGKENIPRNQFMCHKDPFNGDCPRKTCPFRAYGCVRHEELMNQEGLNLHLAENNAKHLVLLQRLVEAQCERSGEELHVQVNGIRQGISGAETKLEDHDWALGMHYRQSEMLRDEVKALEQKVERMEATYAELKQENRNLKQENATTKNRIAALERRADRYDDRFNTLNAQIVMARTLLSSLLRQVEDLSCQNEVQHGELIWKISDVSLKYAEARANPESFLLSPPFYTSRSGYKVCVRLYLNGYGDEWNSNVSFFFVLMKGDYDSILEWPFSRQIELRVMGQETRRGHDEVVPFRPDPQSTSFARPIRGMNVADGVPHCVFPRGILQRHGYVYDNTMFVKVVVHDK